MQVRISSNNLTIGLPCVSGNDDNVESTLSALLEKTLWPFANIEQWIMAQHLTFPTPAPIRVIKDVAIEGYCSWIIPGLGFKSVADFKSHLDKILAKGGEWQEFHVMRAPQAPPWAPPTVSFWVRDSLAVVKDIIGDVRLAKDMKWAPETLYNRKNERIYSELWTGNW
jgi:hypothetical protein